jgi:hypothetical protein
MPDRQLQNKGRMRDLGKRTVAREASTGKMLGTNVTAATMECD